MTFTLLIIFSHSQSTIHQASVVYLFTDCGAVRYCGGQRGRNLKGRGEQERHYRWEDPLGQDQEVEVLLVVELEHRENVVETMRVSGLGAF